MNEVGNIVLVKNIIFDNNQRYEVDHAWAKGRPCLIISTKAEAHYVLPSTSNLKNYNASFINIPQSVVEWETSYHKDSKINLDDLRKLKICARKIVGYLDEVYYYQTICKILSYYDSLLSNEGPQIRFEILEDLQLQKKNIEAKKLLYAKAKYDKKRIK